MFSIREVWSSTVIEPAFSVCSLQSLFNIRLLDFLIIYIKIVAFKSYRIPRNADYSFDKSSALLWNIEYDNFSIFRLAYCIYDFIYDQSFSGFKIRLHGCP